MIQNQLIRKFLLTPWVEIARILHEASYFFNFLQPSKCHTYQNVWSKKEQFSAIIFIQKLTSFDYQSFWRISVTAPEAEKKYAERYFLQFIRSIRRISNCLIF